MDLSVHEIEIPIPISSSNYVDDGGDSHGQSQNHLPPFHLKHHHHLSNSPPPPSLPLQSPAPLSISPPLLGQRTVSVKYRECLKNHAASIGGNATDGCGEFMPSGEEGTIEALKCSACACHRNFHRKEFDGDRCFHHRASGKKFMGQKSSYGLFSTGGGIDSLILPNNLSDHHNQMMMPFGSVQNSDSEERPPPPPPTAKKKRFRTRFTAEQKEKMLCFAEKAGWRLQKQEESVVQQLCSEIGVKRRVLKVWMHNNKHNLAKKASNLQLQ